MTVDIFQTWVESTYNRKITRIQLHRLGFSQNNIKRVYCNKFVAMLSDLDDKTIKALFQLQGAAREATDSRLSRPIHFLL